MKIPQGDTWGDLLKNSVNDRQNEGQNNQDNPQVLDDERLRASRDGFLDLK